MNSCGLSFEERQAARGARKFWVPPDLDEVEKLASHGLTFDRGTAIRVRSDASKACNPGGSGGVVKWWQSPWIRWLGRKTQET
jgi:hypothetical protein